MAFGNLEVQREYIHEMLDGRRLLVMHGTSLMGVQCPDGSWRWIGLYDVILGLNRALNAMRHRFGLGTGRWRLSEGRAVPR